MKIANPQLRPRCDVSQTWDGICWYGSNESVERSGLVCKRVWWMGRGDAHSFAITPSSSSRSPARTLVPAGFYEHRLRFSLPAILALSKFCGVLSSYNGQSPLATFQVVNRRRGSTGWRDGGLAVAAAQATRRGNCAYEMASVCFGLQRPASRLCGLFRSTRSALHSAVCLLIRIQSLANSVGRSL